MCLFSTPLTEHPQHSGHRACGFFPTPSSSPQHQLGPYSATQIWHCLPGESSTSHRVRAQSHKTAPTPHTPSGDNRKLSPVLLINGLQIRGSHSPLLGVTSLLEQLTEPRETPQMLTSLLKGRIKNKQMNIGIKRYIGGGLGGAQMQGPLFPWSGVHHPSSVP